MESDEKCIKFVTSLKTKYRDRLINQEKQWPPCCSNKLIRLELVEKKRRLYCVDEDELLDREEKDINRTPLAYTDLLKVNDGEKPVRRVLINGGAGIGKTTLCVSISEDWANGKLFQQFSLLLLLQLRHKKVSSAGSLVELLRLLHPSKKVCDSVVDYLEEEEGNNVLIIADGWDELDESERQEGSFLYEVLTNDLPLASVIITSRPSASAPLHDIMDRFVEILGFNKDNIEKFIQSEFESEQEKATHLLLQLERNPLIESICSVPLNCAIVCHLWRTRRESLPTTMTELYTKIILNFIFRNIRKLDSYKKIKTLTNFTSFPTEDLQQAWWLLCKFAFQSMIKNQIVFTQQDLAELLPPDSSIESILSFGLLQRAESILEIGCGESFHFLHLTFQEYLAALHLVKQPLYKLLQMLSPDADLSTMHAIFYAMTSNFTMVWRFYFGIYFQECRESKEEPDIRLISQHLSAMREFQIGDEDEDHLHFWHCAFEARNVAVVNKVGRLTFGSDLDDPLAYIHKGKTCNYTNIVEIEFSKFRTTHDCAAVIYLIDNIQGIRCNDVKINFCNIGVRDNQIRTLSDALATKCGKLKVSVLNLEGNTLTDQCISNLFKKASTALKSLVSLNLRANVIGAESIKSITSILDRSSLNRFSELDLSYNPLGIPGLRALEDAIRCESLPKLRLLKLRGSVSRDSDVTNATLLSICNCIDAISVHCPMFSSLDISENRFGKQESAIVHKVDSIQLQVKPYLQIVTLDLRGSKMMDTVVSDLFQKASTALQSLTKLNLSDNLVGAESIKSIATVLARSPSNKLSFLDLSYNPLGIPGLQSLEDAIRRDELINLAQLKLKGSLTSDVDVNITLFNTLIDAISGHCPEFCKLDLSQNNFGADQTSFLVNISLTQENGKLQISTLDLGGNKITDRCLSDLFQKASTTLQSVAEINLRDNMIGAENINFITTVLLRSSVTNRLSIIDLSHNPLGEPGVKALEHAICHGSLINLTQLMLKGSLTSDADVNITILSAFIDAVSTHCPVFSTLDLSQNNFGSSEAAGTAKIIMYHDNGKLQINTLTLSGNKIVDKHVCDLFQNTSHALESTEVLTLTNNLFGAESISFIITILTRLPSQRLSFIDLSFNPLGVLGLKALKDAICSNSLINLTQLNLKGSLTNDADANVQQFVTFINAVSAHCPMFSTLDMSQNNFGMLGTGGTAKLIIHQENGTTLDLHGNKMTNDGVCDIFQKAAVHSIAYLNLNDNSMTGAEGIKAITVAISKSPTNRLSVLNLSHNPLGVIGLQALEDAIRNDSFMCLTQLELKGSLTNDVDINITIFGSFVDALSVHCPAFFKLDLSGNNFGASYSVVAEMTLIKENEKLQINTLKLGNKLTEKCVCSVFQRASGALQLLESLKLGINCIGAESIKSITSILDKSPFNRLSELDLSYNPLGIPGLRALEDAIRHESLPKLQSLNLQGSVICHTGTALISICTCIDAISVHCPKFLTLDISKNCFGTQESSIVTEINSSQLQVKTNLQIVTLDLGGRKMMDTVVSDLFQKASIALQSLTKLNLSDNLVGVESIKSIATVLARSPSNRLSFLDLSYNPLGISGLQALEDAMHNGLLVTLQSLNLLGCLGSVTSTNLKLVSSIFDALSSNCPKLLELNLSMNNIGDLEVLSRFRKNDQAFVHQSADHGALHLLICHLLHWNLSERQSGEVLKNIRQPQLCQTSQNCSITRLILSKNNFSGVGINILVGLVYLCTNLTSLDTSFCRINSDDLSLLLNQLVTLKSNQYSKLQEWNLSNNQIDGAGALNVLDQLTSLFPYLNYKIDIDHNPISEEIMEIIEERVQIQEELLARQEENLLTGSDTEIIQSQWENAVPFIYDVAIRKLLPSYHTIHLEVVGDEEGDTSSLQNTSFLDEDFSHTQVALKSSLLKNNFEEHDGSLSLSHNVLSSFPTLTKFPLSEQSTPEKKSSTPPDELCCSHQSLQLDCSVRPEPQMSHVVQVATGECVTPQRVEESHPTWDLTVDDLAHVQRAVWEGRAKWYNIGLELGLTAGTLDAIQQTNYHDTEDCFRTVLKEWLSDSELQPSWSSLARSLRAPPVGLEQLAHQLPNLHP